MFLCTTENRLKIHAGIRLSTCKTHERDKADSVHARAALESSAGAARHAHIRILEPNIELDDGIDKAVLEICADLDYETDDPELCPGHQGRNMAGGLCAYTVPRLHTLNHA